MEEQPSSRDREPVVVVGASINPLTPRLIFGVAVLLLGVLLALDNLDILDTDRFLDLWPMVFVALGVAKLLDAPRSGRWLAGSLWIALGAWWTAENLGWTDIGVWELFWPVILIIGGFFLIRRALSPRPAEGSSETGGVAVCSGIKRKIEDREFRGGDFTAVMGGCDVDLTRARIVGGEAVIEVFAFWGGIEIKIPPHFTLVPEVTAILGGFSDRTTPIDPDPTQRLVVRGLAMMGGVDVKTVSPDTPPPPPAA